MRLKTDELERRLNEQNISVKGFEFELEFELSELPAIIKEVPTVINSISTAAEKSDSREWEKLCRELGDVKDKLCESERNTRAVEARAEAAERKAQRKQDEVEELRKKLFGTPADEK